MSLEPDPCFNFSTVEEAIKAIQQGEMVIIADDEDRENEGDLVCAAEKITPEMINFMAEKGRGLICLTLTPERCEQLQLHQMTPQNTESLHTAFTVSVDAHQKFGVTTGISVKDRATTIQVAVAPDAMPSDLRRPGHIFPLRARPGGVLERVGQTEASVDLARLAGLIPAGVICEILKPDGTMARRNDLFQFAAEHQLKFITVAQLIAYRLHTERTVRLEAVAALPTMAGAGQRGHDGFAHLADAETIRCVGLRLGHLGERAFGKIDSCAVCNTLAGSNREGSYRYIDSDVLGDECIANEA